MRFLLCLVLLLGAAPLAAQSLGIVRGTVTDAESGTPLPDVNVVVQELRFGTATTNGGQFTLEALRAGTYTLVASRIGFGTVRQRVTVAAGQTAEVTLTLTPRPVDLGEVLALADRPLSAASSQTVRAFDLLTRPVRSSQDLLRLVPGLITAQHAGGGKAEQFFLRGFDADHGTDVAVSVDGMPVNMVSHGHGQGYADLHFLIPDVVERIDVAKGPYEARFGNLATAGAVAFSTKDHLDHNLVRLEGGQFNTASLTALYQIPTPGPHQGAYLAGQFYTTDGPVDSPQNFDRFNLFAKVHQHLGESGELALSLGGFSSAWDASGQVPARAVAAGTIDRFGAIDDLEGGTTGRQDLSLRYTLHQGLDQLLVRGYVSRYTFKLFSNFTFFLDDPVNGDMIEQTDRRIVAGLQGEYRFVKPFLGLPATTTLGTGFRADDGEVGLFNSPNRLRTAARVEAEIAERNLFLWAQEELLLTPWARLNLGLRGDYFTFDVNDRLEGQTNGLPRTSGYTQARLFSPKASLVLTPTRTLDLYLNSGSGFHSNDARNNVLDARIATLVRAYRRDGLTEAEIADRLTAQFYDPTHQDYGTLPRALGAEVGTRFRLLNDRLNVGAAAWLLDLESEFVYIGDAGSTEPSDATRRVGLDLEARASLTAWLAADADLTLSRGTIQDAPAGENRIPLAPNLTSTGGLTVRHPSGLEGSLRYVHIGDRPANEANTVRALGYTVLNAVATYRLRDVTLHLTVENVFDVDWNEAQFDTESQLRNEAAPVSELHYTPGNPFNVRLGLGYVF